MADLWQDRKLKQSIQVDAIENQMAEKNEKNEKRGTIIELHPCGSGYATWYFAISTQYNTCMYNWMGFLFENTNVIWKTVSITEVKWLFIF